VEYEVASGDWVECADAVACAAGPGQGKWRLASQAKIDRAEKKWAAAVEAAAKKAAKAAKAAAAAAAKAAKRNAAAGLGAQPEPKAPKLTALAGIRVRPHLPVGCSNLKCTGLTQNLGQL
jgi:hypothetical protein